MRRPLRRSECCRAWRGSRSILSCILALLGLAVPCGAVDLSHSVHRYPGSTWTPPDTLRVCVTSYPPHVLPVLAAGSTEQPPYDSLITLVPDGVFNDTDVPLLGYDVEYVSLLLKQVLGVAHLQFVSTDTFLKMYLSVRDGTCDLAISAAELDLGRLTCTADCPAVPAGGFAALFANADYEDGFTSGAGPQLLASGCCLEFSVTYFESGLGIASLSIPVGNSLLDSLSGPQVIDSGLIILLIVLAGGWMIVFAEGATNEALDTPAEGVYWSLTTLSTVGYGDVVPETNLGRVVCSLLMLTGLIACSTFTSALSAAITTEKLSVKVLDSFSDLDTTLPVCVEMDYPLAEQVAADNKLRWVARSFSDCIDAVLSGELQAFVADTPILSWMKGTYGLKDMHVSPKLRLNPFGIVYPTGSSLRQWANSAILATQVDDQWKPVFRDLNDRYFNAGPAAPDTGNTASFSRPMLIALCIMVSVTYVSWQFAETRLFLRLKGILILPVQTKKPVTHRILTEDMDGEHDHAPERCSRDGIDSHPTRTRHP